MNKIVLIDIDGTVSKVGDRLKHILQDKPDWDSFYNECFDDEPIYAMIELVELLDKKYNIVFCTGRRESVRGSTQLWIERYFDFDSKRELIMRPNGDHRHDTEVKPELLEIAGIKLKDIAFVIEDRNSMVKKWRELGLICLQPADGDF